MSLQHLRKATWLRAAISTLVLCFALGTLAYAGHTHDANKSSHAHYDCEYCTSFGGLIDPPAITAVAIAAPAPAAPLAIVNQVRFQTHRVGLAQARAPPSC